MPVADFHLCADSRMECLGVSQLHCRLWKCPAGTRLSHTLLFLGLPSASSLNLFQPCCCSLLAQFTPFPSMGDRRVDNQLTSALSCPLRAPTNSCFSLLLHSQLIPVCFFSSPRAYLPSLLVLASGVPLSKCHINSPAAHLG